MKIGFVCGKYLPFVGGIEIHARQVTQELAKRHDVVLGAMNFEASGPPGRFAPLHNNLFAPSAADRTDGRVPIKSLAPDLLSRAVMLPLALRATPRLQRWYYHEINRITRPFYILALRSKLRRMLAGCDVVHCMSGNDLGIAVEKEARAMGMAVVCTPFVHPGQWGDGPDDIQLYQRCDAMIGLVPTDRNYLARLGVPDEKLFVVGVSPCLPAEIDPAAFRAREQIDANPVILYVGRMMAQKGAATLVSAATRVWAKHPKALFYFAGPGTAQELSIFGNVDPRIRYLGRISDQEKAEALAGCDVFCMPSTSEILPTVYLEAWSLGKPVVAGPAHGLRELVEGNRAGLVSEQGGMALAGQLIRMLNDADLRKSCGETGRKLVEEKYSIQAVTSQLEAIYSKVTLRRKAETN